MSDVKSNLPDLFAQLAKARQAHCEAEKAASIARNHETDCLNIVNDLQNRIDDAVLELKKSAPLRTDWRNEVTRIKQ